MRQLFLNTSRSSVESPPTNSHEKQFRATELLWFGVVAYGFFSPFLSLSGIPISWQDIPLMDWQRIGQIIVIFPLFLLATFSFNSENIIRKEYVRGWAALFMLGILSTLHAQLWQPALMELSWLLLLVLAGYMMRHQRYSRTQRLDALLLSSALVSGLLYLWWFWHLNAFYFFFHQPTGAVSLISFPGFANIRFFSDYQSILLLIIPIAIERLVPIGLARSTCNAAGMAFFALALIAGSRSLIFAHLLTHTVLLFVFGNIYKPYLFKQLKFWIGGTIFFIFLTEALPWILSNSSSNTATSLARTDTSGRNELWLLAWELIKENPILGVGPLHFSMTANHIASSPHNFLIQITVEWGIPAALTLCAIFARILFDMQKKVKLENAKGSPISLGITAACIAIIFESFVASSPFNYPVGQTLALMCFAYPAGTALESHPKNTCALSNSFIRSFSILLATLFILSVNTLENVRERNSCFYFNPWPTAYFSPRFWQQGWLAGQCGHHESLATNQRKVIY